MFKRKTAFIKEVEKFLSAIHRKCPLCSFTSKHSTSRVARYFAYWQKRCPCCRAFNKNTFNNHK